MKVNPDDPRLTAYSLGELDAADRKVIEAELEGVAECRRELEEIARTVSVLNAELAAEPLPTLTYAQQLVIEAKLKPKSSQAEARKGFLSAAQFKTGLIRRILVLAGAVAVIFATAIASFWFYTHLPKGSQKPPSRMANATPRGKSDGYERDDDTFAHWAAPYQRMHVPLIPIEDVVNYSPPEILPIPPAPTIRNGE